MQNKIPLAERMRPKKLDDYIGQTHIVGSNTALRKAIDRGVVPSMIFWGPPGVGKTTLAGIIAETVDRPFFGLSAINSGVKEIREIIEKVKNQGLFGGNNAILFIDEIHRFNKSQQDSLLGAVEKGIITLIGATTENPSFEVNAALLSRTQVYVLKELEKDDLLNMLHQAIAKDSYLKKKSIQVNEYEALLRISGGDGRKLLNNFEIVVDAFGDDKVIITNDQVTKVVQQNSARYDKSGEQHYDIISAFIKSIRGSDPNGAVYWLARMIEGGEEPKFIARRLLISASEDIGNANPTALIMANTCFQAVSTIGWPESRLILSQCTIYLACSVKSSASYDAINSAQQLVKKTGDLQVPIHLRNAPTKLMNDLGYGKGYKYAHAYENSFVNEEFLPDGLEEYKLYEPKKNKREEELRRYLKYCWGTKYEY